MFGRRNELVDDDLDLASLADAERSFDELVALGDFANVSLYGNGLDTQCFDLVDKFLGSFPTAVSDVVDDDVGTANC